MSLLERFLASARRRARSLPPARLDHRRRPLPFAPALAGKQHLDVIAEFKRSSPSRGVLAPARDVAVQAGLYARAGAAAMSVLTEPDHFGGSPDDLALAVRACGLPVLMKDFVLDESQVELAASLGASAVLLIARILNDAQLTDLAAVCAVLNLTPLIECHDERDLERALAVEPAVIGVNNRDLQTLKVDRGTARRLLARVPSSRVAVAESGYGLPEDTREVAGLADAVLIGSGLMTSEDPQRFIREVRA